MTEEWTLERWETAVRAVFRRAMFDREFRALALRDAPAAFAVAAGVPLPPGLPLRFAERLEETVLVLPQVIHQPTTLSEIDVSRILHHSYRQQSVPPAFPG